jgi:hypothetical protein
MTGWGLKNFQEDFAPFTHPTRRRHCVVGTATGYGLDRQGVRVRVSVVQIGSGTQPAFYPMGSRGPFPGANRPGREDDHSQHLDLYIGSP